MRTYFLRKFAVFFIFFVFFGQPRSDAFDAIEDLRKQIEGDVLDFNSVAEAQGLEGPIPVLKLAGSSSTRKKLYSTEARVHYLSLLRDISPRSYVHHSPIPIRMINELVPLIQEKLNDLSFHLFTTIIGDGQKHFATLALDRSGSCAIIDSSTTGFLFGPAATRKARKDFAARLDSTPIFSENGAKIKFEKCRYITAFQQRDHCNCLIFSLLNTHQIAKRASIDAYKEVSFAFQSGFLNSYDDLFKIGDLQQDGKSKPVWTIDNWRSYFLFMRNFRIQTQILIREYLENAQSF